MDSPVMSEPKQPDDLIDDLSHLPPSHIAKAREPRGFRQWLLSKLRGTQTQRELREQGAQIGKSVLLGRDSYVDASFAWLVTIGDETIIAPGVEIIAHDASTKPLLGYTIVAPVNIGDRVYIGTGATILPGVTVGDGAIVGARAVVRDDVAPNTMVVGSPARPVGTVDEYIARHRRNLSHRPVWPSYGWTTTRGITPERRQEMRRALADGPGYID